MSIHAVVTGANRGIGLELVRQLARRGDRVEATARAPGQASALAAIAAEAGGRVRVHALELTDPAGVAAFAAALGSAPIDVVFNVAGVYGDERSLRQLTEDLPLADVAATFDINAIGPLRLTL